MASESKQYDILVPQMQISLLTQSNLLAMDWDMVPALPPFKCAENGELASQQTVTRLCCSARALYIRFDCQDYDIWGIYTQQDQPIYDEEVVEVFLSAGIDDPTHYYEFEISPNGVLFDAEIFNPTSERENIRVNADWDCENIRWKAIRYDSENRWSASLMIPWASVSPAATLPPIWRANFYRIERPRNAEPEFSCWSPTMTVPADFHKPKYFGTLRLPQSLLEG